MNGYPEIRLRRLRQKECVRKIFDDPVPPPSKFIWPAFVVEGTGRREPIPAMPGQMRLSPDELIRDLVGIRDSGIGGILLFGVVDESSKDSEATAASKADGVVQEAVKAVKQAFPDLLLATDVCMCAYMDHGHCGPLNQHGDVENDAANEILARIALSHARAGADIVAPSAMMDGQVKAIRQELDCEGFENTLIMSYSSKFASSMYGPFRDAENSAPQSGDRQGYQASYANPRAALRESRLDAAEGADILMVKPALFYLDVLAKIRSETDLPLAAYNVSGEYSMIHATAEHGWGDLRHMARESMAAIARAGADVIISYWANRYNEIFRD